MPGTPTHAPHHAIRHACRSALLLALAGALASGGLMAPTPASAGFRAMEPVVILGESFPALNGVPVADVHAYAYQGGQWVAIPYQIDERSASGSLFAPDDGLWDANDDFVVQPQVGGEPAPGSAWVDDAEAKTRPRYELHCHDAVEVGSRYIYLFLSSTIVDTTTTTYVAFDAVNDKVYGGGFQAGFDPAGKFWDELRVDEGGGYGADLLDRQKTRVKGRVFFINFTLTEEDYITTNLLTKVGPVRLSRYSTGYYSILGIQIDGESSTDYFGAYIGSPVDTMEVNSVIEEVRTSLDLSTAAIGTVLSDPMNPSLLVNGIPDSGVQTSIPAPLLSSLWAKANFGASSLVMVGDLSGVAPTNLVYYHDDFGGGTLDGTDDTGDGVSVGDYGVWIQNPVTGEHILRQGTFIGVGANLSGPVCQAYFASPISVSIAGQTWDPTAAPLAAAPSNGLRLEPSRPNPFAGATEVRFRMPAAGRVDLSVYDITGRLVGVLLDETRAAGPHAVTWEPRGLGAGVYLFRLEANGEVRVRKSVVLR